MKVVVITGTSSGIGLQTTLELAKQGYKVVALMREQSDRTALDVQLTQLSLTQQVEVIKLNLANVQDINHTIDYIVNTYKRIDVVINNAGYAQGGLVELVHSEAWEQQFKTNVLLPINICKAVAPIMRQQRFGKIINVGSISGKLGLPAYAPYAMSKFALAGFSESLRLELLPFNVYVVLIEAGSYQTAIWEKGFSTLPNNHIADYDPLQQRMVELTNQSATTPRSPVLLAKFICTVINKKKPTLYQVPTFDIKLIIVMKSLFKWKWFENIMFRFVLKMRK